MKAMILFGLLLGVTQAFASDDGDALVRSGLAGTWAQDCAAPPKDGNWYDRYEVTKGGEVTETLYNSGEKIFRASKIYAVHILSSDRLAYSMHDADGETLDLVVQMDGKRHRTWSSRGDKGKMYIDQGKLVSDGSEGTWFTKCER